MKKNTPYFYVIMFALPFLLLGFIEASLRALGIGHNVPLVLENPEFPGYLHVNPNIIQRYFPDPALAPKVRPDIVLFEKNKSANTFRIVVQGGSTAAGFPYGREASLQGMLNQRFKRLYPERHIEVISTAMAAVNSYTMLDFADEILDIKPDLIVIYAGHNEYLGVMGVGSNYASIGGRTATLLYIKLRGLHLYQAIETLIRKLRPRPGPTSGDQRSLMATVAKEKSIPFNSTLYQRGLEQFQKNLESLLETYQNANVPVLIGTLASNEKDQVPFSSVGEIDWERYRATLENSDQAASESSISTLTAKLEKHKNAADFYKLGLLHYKLATEPPNRGPISDDQQGNEKYAPEHKLAVQKKARDYFITAKDYDELRFRAPKEFNTIITTSADTFSATPVDTQSFLLADTDEKLIGNNLMLEHVHPNERGYFLLAEAFVEKILQQQFIDDKAQNYSARRAWIDNPLTEISKLEGDYAIKKLTSDYPFTTDKNKTEQTIPLPSTNTIAGKGLALKTSSIDWLSFQQQMRLEYQSRNNIREASRIAANTSDSMVSDVDAAMVAGSLYAERGDHRMAIFYFSRAARLAPENRDVLTTLTTAYFAQDSSQTDAEILQRIKKLKQ